MATLHMDTQEVRNIVTNLSNKRAELEQYISLLHSSIYSVVGNDWRAQSANQLLAEFEPLASQLRNEVTELNSIINGINDEIEKWEAFARSLGL